LKILLLGDFSGLHLNLRDGLREHGHEAIVASSGDGWKKFQKDIDISLSWNGRLDKIRRITTFLFKLTGLTGYDVIQLINPSFLGIKPHKKINQYLMDLLRRHNNKSYLLCTGEDSYYWLVSRYRLRYSPHDDYIKHDLGQNEIQWLEKSVIGYNKKVATSVQGIIPMAYEFSLGYEHFPNLLPPVHLPVNLNKIQFQRSFPGKRLVVFHGLNREGFKGTRHIRTAFEMLQKKYPNDLELVMDGRMPYDKYVEIIRRANVIVDQAYSYGWGMNAVIALAMGKIVLSGAEPEALAYLGLQSSPIINILPYPDDIVSKIEYVLEHKKEVEHMGQASRAYAEQHHDHVKVAGTFLDRWNASP